MQNQIIFKTMINIALSDNTDKHIYECKDTMTTSYEFDVDDLQVSVTLNIFECYINISKDLDTLLCLVGSPVFYENIEEISREEFYEAYDRILPEGKTHRVG